MSHVFCHDKAGNGAGRPQHDNDGNQLVLCKTATDGKRKKKCFITDKFHKCTGNRCFQPGKGFSEVQRSAHSHEPRGVAVFARLPAVESRIFGNGRRRRDQSVPAAMPRMMGLVTIPFKVRFRTVPSIFPDRV